MRNGRNLVNLEFRRRRNRSLLVLRADRQRQKQAAEQNRNEASSHFIDRSVLLDAWRPHRVKPRAANQPIDSRCRQDANVYGVLSRVRARSEGRKLEPEERGKKLWLNRQSRARIRTIPADFDSSAARAVDFDFRDALGRFNWIAVRTKVFAVLAFALAARRR